MGGFQLAGQDAQEGGFSGAVGADDAIAVAGGKFQIHMGKKILAVKIQAHIGNCDQRWFLISPRRVFCLLCGPFSCAAGSLRERDHNMVSYFM